MLNNKKYRIPGKSLGLFDILFFRRYLLSLIVQKELKIRYKASLLGIMWSYIKPAIHFLTLYIALGIIMKISTNINNYAIYLFSGLIVINLFSEALSNSTRSIVANSVLIKKIYIPREIFPLSSILVSIIHFFPQLIVLNIALILNGWEPNIINIIGGFLGLGIIVLLATSLGLLFSALNVYFRDIENIIDMFLIIIPWLSPVLYPWSMIQNSFHYILKILYACNPITIAIELFHQAFWAQKQYQFESINNLLLKGIFILIIMFSILLICQAIFKKLEGNFAREL